MPFSKALKPKLKIKRCYSLYRNYKPTYKAGEYYLAFSYVLGTKKNKGYIKAKYIVLLLCAKSIPNFSY